VKELAFFPGMQMTGDRKVAIVHEMIELMRSSFTVLAMNQHAEAIKQTGGLATVNPASLNYNNQFAN
jgi:hypothetical protein